MRVRESGMPEESYWETFFNPKVILSKLELNQEIVDAAELGSGYGTFSIEAAGIIKGILHAIEMEPLMIERLSEKIQNLKIDNILIHKIDFMNEGTRLENESMDYVMLFNILHTKEPVKLLKEAYRILKKGGKAGVIHWNYSPETPRGPSLIIRPKPEQCLEWLTEVKFKTNGNIIPLPPYHYGILAVK